MISMSNVGPPLISIWVLLVRVLISMCSKMKHDAIVEQGIPILERIPIPDELIPEDSRVEIDAKIHAGYCELFSDNLTLNIQLNADQNLQSLLGKS